MAEMKHMEWKYLIDKTIPKQSKRDWLKNEIMPFFGWRWRPRIVSQQSKWNTALWAILSYAAWRKKFDFWIGTAANAVGTASVRLTPILFLNVGWSPASESSTSDSETDSETGLPRSHLIRLAAAERRGCSRSRDVEVEFPSLPMRGLHHFDVDAPAGPNDARPLPGARSSSHPCEARERGCWVEAGVQVDPEVRSGFPCGISADLLAQIISGARDHYRPILPAARGPGRTPGFLLGSRNGHCRSEFGHPSSGLWSSQRGHPVDEGHPFQRCRTSEILREPSSTSGLIRPPQKTTTEVAFSV